MPLTPEVQSSLAVGRRRARIAAALLAAATIVDAAQAVSYWMQKRLLDRIAAHIPDPHEVYEANDLRVRALAVVALVLLAATGIAFLSWLHRAVRNAREVNPEFLGTTPGAAVGAFFIPFVNFVRPVMVIRALDRAVEPSELPLPDTWVPNDAADYRTSARRRVTVPWVRVKAPIAVWWASYVIMSIGSRFFSEVPDPRTAGIHAAADYSVGSAVLNAFNVIAGLLAIAVVRGIDARTTERARRAAALPSSEPAAVATASVTTQP